MLFKVHKIDMKEIVNFESRQHFRKWLEDNHLDHKGIWIRFEKSKEKTVFKAEEALEEALCFGWIDSTITKIDEQYYIKYFAKRQLKSIWSEKNKGLVKKLIKDGLMMPEGFKAIENAKSNGLWDKTYKAEDDLHYLKFLELVKKESSAYKNLIKMSLSIQKTYARHYFSAKQEVTKEKRFKEIIERLSKNLKPM